MSFSHFWNMRAASSCLHESSGTLSCSGKREMLRKKIFSFVLIGRNHFSTDFLWFNSWVKREFDVRLAINFQHVGNYDSLSFERNVAGGDLEWMCSLLMSFVCDIVGSHASLHETPRQFICHTIFILYSHDKQHNWNHHGYMRQIHHPLFKSTKIIKVNSIRTQRRRTIKCVCVCRSLCRARVLIAKLMRTWRRDTFWWTPKAHAHTVDHNVWPKHSHPRTTDDNVKLEQINTVDYLDNCKRCVGGQREEDDASLSILLGDNGLRVKHTQCANLSLLNCFECRIVDNLSFCPMAMLNAHAHDADDTLDCRYNVICVPVFLCLCGCGWFGIWV